MTHGPDYPDQPGMPEPGMMQPDDELVGRLIEAGLIDSADNTVFVALAGGVSSDIWRVQTDTRTFCVKRALTRLKVAAEWLAPIERNRYEVAWLRRVHAILPEAVPEVLWADDEAMMLAMAWLAPDEHPVWKQQLKEGRAQPGVAAEVGRRLGRIHAATADPDALMKQFPRADIFHAIRLEPYLEATAERHPDLRKPLYALSSRTAAERRVMIHGDVSPKNILIGPGGPVFLDAECACVGDPAFDLAFCLNHLLLKCLWCPDATPAFLACFEKMSEAYLKEVTWEPRQAVEIRAATLLPGCSSRVSMASRRWSI